MGSRGDSEKVFNHHYMCRSARLDYPGNLVRSKIMYLDPSNTKGSRPGEGIIAADLIVYVVLVEAGY